MNAWVRRAVVVAVWASVLVAWRRYQTANGLGTAEAGQEFIDAVDAAWWGALAYVAVYLARPIVLFPASILTVVGGLLFGPVWGVLVVVVAANLSAAVAFGIGRLLGRTPDAVAPADDDAVSLLGRWDRRLRARSFETVFVMRLLFLPYDLVNYLCGALRIRFVPFLVATALGSLPGTVSFVLLGASLERVDEGLDGIDPWVLASSVAIFVVSLAVARRLRRRETVPVEPLTAGSAGVRA